MISPAHPPHEANASTTTGTTTNMPTRAHGRTTPLESNRNRRIPAALQTSYRDLHLGYARRMRDLTHPDTNRTTGSRWPTNARCSLESEPHWEASFWHRSSRVQRAVREPGRLGFGGPARPPTGDAWATSLPVATPPLVQLRRWLSTLLADLVICRCSGGPARRTLVAGVWSWSIGSPPGGACKPNPIARPSGRS
jgi:hypothetical protein